MGRSSAKGALMWKKLSVSLLVLLLSPSVLYSDYVLTDEDYEAIMNALDESETELERQERRIAELESLLTQLREQQEISERVINLLSIESEKLEGDLKTRERDNLISILKNIGVGFLIGFGVGGYSGFSLGVRVQY